MSNPYREALNQARGELAGLNQQIEELRRRKEGLENLVKCLIPMSTDNATMELNFAHEASAEGENNNARKSPNGTKDLIVAAIKSAARALTVPEIHQYATGIMQANAPKPDAIRILMRRRTDTFQSIGSGRYTLREMLNESNGKHEVQKEDWSF